MKFICEKEKLLQALSITSRTVSPKNNILALEGIKLEVEDQEVILTGYNLETGIRAQIPAQVSEKGTLVLSARLFLDIVRKMPNQEIKFQAKDYQITITCGQIQFQVMAIPPEDFPELPEVNQNQGFVLSQTTLKSMITATIFAVSHTDSRPIHTGSLFEVKEDVLTIVSVDGYRLALRREPLVKTLGADLFSFVVPSSALSEVEKICNTQDDITVTLSPKHICFQFPDCMLVTRRLEGEFIDYGKAIPKNNTVKVFVSRRELAQSVDRVSLMISEKLKAPLRCFFRDGALDISSKTPVGEANDHCVLEGHGGDVEVGLNHRYMQEALRVAPADKLRLEFSSAVQPCLLLPESEDDESFCYMVLPVRLKSGG